MARFRVLGGLDPVRKLSRGISRRARNLRPAMSALQKDFKREQMRHFKEEVGPDEAWPPRSDVVVKRSIAARNKALQERGSKTRARKPSRALGKLKDFMIIVTRTDITAISYIPWSGAHQNGATVGRGAKLPARPFLWVDRPWLRKYARRKILRYMVSGRR